MDEVATKVIEILKKHMKEPRDDISLDTQLTDLKIESLDLAMIVFDIEDGFGIEIPQTDFAAFGRDALGSLQAKARSAAGDHSVAA